MGGDNNCCQKRDNELEGMALPGSKYRGRSQDQKNSSKGGMDLAYLIKEDN